MPTQSQNCLLCMWDLRVFACAVCMFVFVCLCVGEDAALLFYKELYYRHLYVKTSPTLNDRMDSFQNYASLFNWILSLDVKTPQVSLPISWLWDMVDEFIYQFQSFHTYRNKKSALPASDIPLLKEHEHVR